jgi:WD40 repeat protein
MVDQIKDTPGSVISYPPIQYDPGVGINTLLVPHQEYLKALAIDFKRVMLDGIDRTANDVAEMQKDEICVEVIKHLQFANHRGNSHIGRAEVIEKVSAYLSKEETPDDPHSLLTIYGASGTGKTSIMAKACIETYHMSLQRGYKSLYNATIVVRFVGTSAGSTTSRLLMRSICRQLSRVYDKRETIPDDYAELVQYFKVCLFTWGTIHRPIVIFLDSLDHLSNDDNGLKLTWLPMKNLPHTLKLVVTTQPLTGERGEDLVCLRMIQAAMSKGSDASDATFIHVKPLELHEGQEMLDSWLARAGRMLTDEQHKYVMQMFQACAVPLYLKLCFQSAVRWASYDTGKKVMLSAGLNGMIVALFKKLEYSYGDMCVQHALGLISAAKVGLSEGELEDILSCDEAVLNEVFQWWLPPVRRLPPLLWARIRDDLGSLLIVRGHYEVRAYTWYHSCVRAAAEEMFVKPEVAHIFHMKLANYFSGRWAKEKKSFYYQPHQLGLFARELSLKYGEEKWKQVRDNGAAADEDRKVQEQPLYFDQEQFQFNHRKLVELPYHLIRCGKWGQDLLAEHCLANYDFLLAKLRATSVPDVIADFADKAKYVAQTAELRQDGMEDGQYVMAELRKTTTDYSNDGISVANQIQLVGDALVLGAHVLALDPEQLASQLLGRLDIDRIVRASSGSATVIADLRKTIMDKIGSQPHPHMVPIAATLPGAGGPLIRTLAGHSDKVVKVDALNDASQVVSASEDGTAKLWDLDTGAEIRTFEGHSKPLTSIKVVAGGTYIVTASWDKKVLVWETGSGQYFYSYLGHSLTPNALTPVSADTVISAGNDGVVQVWKIGSSGANVSLRAEGRCGWVMDTAYANPTPTKNIVASAMSDGTVDVWDLNSCAKIGGLAGHSAACTSVEFTSDSNYLISASRDCTAVVWRLQDRRKMYIIDHHQKAVTKALPTHDMRYIVTASEDKTLAVCTFAEGTHLRTFLGHTKGVTDCILTTDNQFIISCSEDQTLKMWKFQTTGGSEYLPRIPGHTQEINSVAISDDGKHVASASSDRMIKVWDEDGNEKREIKGGHGSVTGVSLSPNGDQIVASFWGKYTIVYDRESGEMEATMYDDGVVLCCIFHPDGKRILTGCQDNTIKVWDFRREAKTKRFAEHTAPVTAMAFCPGGRFFVSGSQDRSCILWDFACDFKMWEYHGHVGTITCVVRLPRSSRSGFNRMRSLLRDSV